MNTKKYLMDRDLAQVNLRLPNDLLADFKELCQSRDQTLSQGIRNLMRAELLAQPAQEPQHG